MQIKSALSIIATSLVLAACGRESAQQTAPEGAPEQTPEAAPAGIEASGWARATPPGAPVAAAYLDLRNTGAADDALLAVETPLAGRVEIHTMNMEEGVMRMRQVERLDLPAQQSVTMAPGGLHLMLMELNQPLVAGESVVLSLRFEQAGAMEVSAVVAPVGATAPPQ
jgi:hypothetical protein